MTHALDNGDDVTITYVDRNGSQTVRPIRPNRIHGKWLDSWCLSANGQRDFTIANILAVVAT